MSTSTSELERAAASLDAEGRRRLLAVLVRAYAEERDGSPIEPGAVEPIQVMVTVADMLRTAEVTSFELAAMCNV